MNSSGFYPITLVDKVHEYGSVYTLRFAGDEAVPFVPGQYVHFLAPASAPGRENVRHLSIASTPAEGALRFSVDLAPTSDFKRKLAALQPGGKAHLFKVKGAFVLSDPLPRQVVFVAGGLGVTPIRALIQQVVTEKLPIEWRLLHVARNGWLYQAELEGWGGTQRRVGRDGVAAVLDRWTAEVPGATYYLCGSHRFVEGLAGALSARGVTGDRLRVEDFE